MNIFTKSFSLSPTRSVRAYLTLAPAKREMLKIVCLSVICLFTLTACHTKDLKIEVDGIYYNLNVDKKEAEVVEAPNTANYTGDVKIPSKIYYLLTKYGSSDISSDATVMQGIEP